MTYKARQQMHVLSANATYGEISAVAAIFEK